MANFSELADRKVIPSPASRLSLKSNFAAEKSISHALGPLAMFYIMGYPERSTEFKNLALFYENYLTARQLNDDAHDWESDLLKNQRSLVIEMLESDFVHKHGRASNYPSDKIELRQIFWHITIDEVSSLIINSVKRARKRLSDLQGIVSENFLSEKLEELEHSALKALDEKGQTTKYLDNVFE